jgi:hypothetical protein
MAACGGEHLPRDQQSIAFSKHRRGAGEHRRSAGEHRRARRVRVEQDHDRIREQHWHPTLDERRTGAADEHRGGPQGRRSKRHPSKRASWPELAPQRLRSRLHPPGTGRRRLERSLGDRQDARL